MTHLGEGAHLYQRAVAQYSHPVTERFDLAQDV